MNERLDTGTVALEERREAPTRLERKDGSTGAVLKRTIKGFSRDNLTDWAAALTYYGVLAIFPALIVLVSVLGLIGESATQPLIDNLGKVAPGPAKDIVTSALKNLQGSKGTAGVAFVVGLLLALWSASGYVAAFMRASNAIYDIPEGRPVWKTLPLRVVMTLVLVLLLALSAVGVTLTGGLAKEAGGVIGLSDTAVSAWNIAKWPVLVVVVSFMFALLYWAAPNVKHPKFRWVSPGGVLAVIGWIVASLAFAFYVANFGSYNKTYGALAGPIVFLVWLWVSNLMILLGAEFNAELERGKAALELRDTRKIDDEERRTE
jgi:membrane protein